MITTDNFKEKAYLQILKCCFILLFTLISLPLLGQDTIKTYIADETVKKRFRYIEFKGHAGGHIYTGEKLSEAIESGYSAIEVRFAWQSTGNGNWTEHYGSPSYGVGWYSGFIGDPQLFGKPNALFGFINFPLSKPGRRNTFELSPSFGLTYNLEPFDAEDNPLNDAIGSRIDVYFNLSYGGSYILNRELNLIYGIDFSHFSNGRTFTPNSGLNMFGLHLGMRYHYNADQHILDDDPYSPSQILPARHNRKAKALNEKLEKDSNSINLYAAIGTVQNDSDQGTDTRYTTYSIVTEYRKKFNNMHGITAGLDLFYDESIKAKTDVTTEDRYFVGIHAGYDFMFWRFAIRGQFGTYINGNDLKGSFFMRPALQYEITKSLHAQVGLKTLDGGAADWIEFGVGFTPFNW